MKIASTSEMSDRAVVTAFVGTFNETITTRQGRSFKQSRLKDWNSAGSIQQEESKHKKRVQQVKEW